MTTNYQNVLLKFGDTIQEKRTWFSALFIKSIMQQLGYYQSLMLLFCCIFLSLTILINNFKLLTQYKHLIAIVQYSIWYVEKSSTASPIRQFWKNLLSYNDDNEYIDLPVRPFDAKLSKFNQNKCVICLDHFKDGIRIRELSCCHEFHRDCIGIFAA
ncbi:hypothetical protein K501DRAFT_277058 [Backusella circina FSU 941]|nr:hypothetical protein K501DRAFT_277058 [Backusella circina FSU 941]